MSTQQVKSKLTGRTIEVCDLTPHQRREILHTRLMRAAAGAVVVAGGIIAGAVLSALVRRPRI